MLHFVTATEKETGEGSEKTFEVKTPNRSEHIKFYRAYPGLKSFF